MALSGGNNRRPEPRLTLERVTVDYGTGDTPALNEVSLDLAGGRIVGLLGANGAGKSTLIQVCAGVRAPTSGRVVPIGTLVGWCSQQLMIDWFVSVRTNVWLGARLSGLTGRTAWRRAEECLALMELNGEILDATPEVLSGGQQQRLMIARVLAMQAPIMLLDEPTVGLDLASIGRLRQTLETARDKGALIVISSHDFSAIEPLVDDVVLLDHGHMLFHGHRRDFVATYARHEVVNVTLTRPASQPLLDAVTSHGAGRRQVEVSEDGITLAVTQPVGQELGALLRNIEQAGWAVRDLTRHGVSLEQAFVSALERRKGSR